MSKILFICAGNVARSQMAEAFYNHFTGTDNAVSAGVLDYTPAKYGHPVQEAVTVMREEGMDIADNIVKTVTENMCRSAGRIYVMCPKEDCPEILLKYSGKIIFWNIPDPYDSSVDNYRLVRDRIKNLVTLDCHPLSNMKSKGIL